MPHTDVRKCADEHSRGGARGGCRPRLLVQARLGRDYRADRPLPASKIRQRTNEDDWASAGEDSSPRARDDQRDVGAGDVGAGDVGAGDVGAGVAGKYVATRSFSVNSIPSSGYCASTLALISAAVFDFATFASQSAMYFFIQSIARMSCVAAGP